MLKLRKPALVAAVSLLTVVAAGCASGGKSASGEVASGGMMCPKCETVWVSKVVGQGTKVQRLAHDRKMTCPDCDAMAQSQLTGDGKVMLHDCPTCKVTPRPVSPDPRPLTHPKGTHG